MTVEKRLSSLKTCAKQLFWNCEMRFYYARWRGSWDKRIEKKIKTRQVQVKYRSMKRMYVYAYILGCRILLTCVYILFSFTSYERKCVSRYYTWPAYTGALLGEWMDGVYIHSGPLPAGPSLSFNNLISWICVIRCLKRDLVEVVLGHAFSITADSLWGRIPSSARTVCVDLIYADWLVERALVKNKSTEKSSIKYIAKNWHVRFPGLVLRCIRGNHLVHPVCAAFPMIVTDIHFRLSASLKVGMECSWVTWYISSKPWNARYWKTTTFVFLVL